jgi:hypothetical protein
MTDKELQSEINQAQQDAITLDFSKWSFQQRRAGKAFDHQSWQTARDAVLSRQRWDNATARNQRLSQEQAVKDARTRQHEREIDAELLPTKLRLKRDWLANNPTFTEADFEEKAWNYLRQNLIEERKTDAANAEIKRQLASGRY